MKMKKFLMILTVLVFISGCAATKKQIAQDSIPSLSPAPEAEKGGGLRIEQGCVADHRDKYGTIFIEVKCKQERFVNIIVNLKPDYQYFVLIGDLSSIRKTTLDGYIVLENPLGENIILILEMTYGDIKKIKPSPPVDLHFGVTTDKPANTLKNSADKGGE